MCSFADCLYINLYRSCKDKLCNAEPKCIIMVEGYLGCESGFQLDRESNTLAIICTSQTVLLAFDTHEILYQWQEKLQQHFCKGKRHSIQFCPIQLFPVEQYYLVHIISIPAKSKLTCGPARLLLQDFLFCLVSGIPPRLLCHWPIKHLRRFGAVDGKFCFEGGSQSGKGRPSLYTILFSLLCFQKQFSRESIIDMAGWVNLVTPGTGGLHAEIENASARTPSVICNQVYQELCKWTF